MKSRCRNCCIGLIIGTLLINTWIYSFLINVPQILLDDFESIRWRNYARLEKLQEQCNEFGLSNGNIFNMSNSELRNIIVDQEHKLFYCFTPKVACTTWKRVLMIINKKWNTTDTDKVPGNLVHERGQFKSFVNLTLDEQKEALNYYTKFMIVRNPFERLLSAYKDKLQSYKRLIPFFQQIAETITNNTELLQKLVPIDPKTSSELNKKQHRFDVEFYKFIQYLLSPPTKNLYNYPLNEHWRPMYQVCHPCLINYTILAKYETIKEDSDLVLNTIGVQDMEFPPARPMNKKTKMELKKYFQSIPFDIALRLYDFYEIDFKLFGYDALEVIKRIYQAEQTSDPDHPDF